MPEIWEVRLFWQKRRKSERTVCGAERFLPEENCKAVIDICFLEDGTMRIAYRDSEAKLKTADSKDQGKSWETPRDLWEEFGKSEKAEPMTVNLSKTEGFSAAGIVWKERILFWQFTFQRKKPKKSLILP